MMFSPHARSEEEQVDGVRHGMTIPLPFITGPVGSGDLVKSLTDALHIPQCGGCGRRQEAMNQAVAFRPMRSLWED